MKEGGVVTDRKKPETYDNSVWCGILDFSGIVYVANIKEGGGREYRNATIFVASL